MKNYYKILGLSSQCSLVVIKKAYRQLALRYHPDKNKSPDAATKFIEITEAYEVLRDRTKRAAYDYLYEKYFVKGDVAVYQETTYKQQQTNWTDYGSKKAKEYSSMRYEDFVQRVFDEVKIGISYIPNLVFIGLISIGVIGFISILPDAMSDGSDGMGGFLLLCIIGYGILVYFLFKRMQADYKEERKRKFKK